MANRKFYQESGHLDPGLVTIQGSFATNGSSAVASTSVKGKGFSVAHSSTGTFTITLQDAYVGLISATASLQLATADDKFLQWGAIDVTSAKTAVLRVWDISGAALTDIAANAGNRINFCLHLSNSTIA